MDSEKISQTETLILD